MRLNQSYTPYDERDLIALAKQGDSDAFKSIYEAHRYNVYNLILYSLNDSRFVEDVLQIVFLKVYRGLAGFRFECALSTWIYRVTINECQNQNRTRRARFVPLDAIVGGGEEIDTAPFPETEHATRERDAIIRQAVMDLSPKLRTVVVLKYVEGLSYDEISDILQLRPGTIASRLNRALEGLEDRLRPLCPIL